MRRKASAGFTLVEVLVVAAILGVMVAGFMQFMAYQQRVNRTGEVSSEIVQVRQLVSSWLESQQICTSTFGGLGLNATNNVTEITRAENDVVYSLGQRLPGTSWAVTTMRLLNRAEALAVSPAYNGDVDDAGVGTGLFEVTVRQMRAGSNTETVNWNEQRGNMAPVERVLHFPFRASFILGQLLDVIDSNPNPNLDCGPGVILPGGTSTLLQAIQSEDPTASEANTNFAWQDGMEEEVMDVPCPSLLLTTCSRHIRMCNAININMPIARCIPSGIGAD